jgi:hypothetical protein
LALWSAAVERRFHFFGFPRRPTTGEVKAKKTKAAFNRRTP